MKILVYGAGAVGGYLGGRLARSGHDVTLITRQYIAETINNSGLSLTEAGQTINARPKAVDSVAQAFMGDENSYDLIIMSMKSYDLVPALDPLVAFCPHPSVIITMQNGINVEQPLIDQYGAEHIIAGSLTTPIHKETPTSLVVSRRDRGLGLSPTRRRQNIKQWQEVFQKAGIKSVGVADYHSMKWSKALLNILGNATSAILNRTPGVIYKSPTLFELELRMVRETLVVMDSLNLKIVDLPGSPTSRLVTGLQRMPQMLLKPLMTNLVAKGRGGKMPSFHIDLASGKGKCEVEYHNGAIAKAGQAQGITTPVNYVLNDLLMKLAREEVDWRVYDGKPKMLLQEIIKYEASQSSRP
jgi:2-dehydropantoate 2-reductase